MLGGISVAKTETVLAPSCPFHSQRNQDTEGQSNVSETAQLAQAGDLKAGSGSTSLALPIFMRLHFSQ